MEKSEEELAREESAELLKAANEIEAAEAAQAAAPPPAPEPEEDKPPEKSAEELAKEAEEEAKRNAETDDPDFLKADLVLTEEEVKTNRTNMLSNIEAYMRKGTVNRETMMSRKYAKPLPVYATEEEAKNAAFEKSKKMAAKRAARHAELKKTADTQAKMAADEEYEELAASGGVNPSTGKPLTDEEKKAKQLEQMRIRKEKAARRRSRSRSESAEAEAALASPTSDGGFGGDVLEEEEEEEAEPEVPLSPEERKAKEMAAMVKRKEKAQARRNRSRADEAKAAGGGAGSPGMGDSETIPEYDVLGDDVVFDDEELLSPNTRARKPAAQPGCAVHSVGGKFVQVPIFGSAPSTVPSANKRKPKV